MKSKISKISKRFLIFARFYLVMLLQMFLVIVGYNLAFNLRFDFQIPRDQLAIMVKTLPLLLVCRVFAYSFYKLNSGCWRFVGIIDLTSITKAVFVGTVLFLIGLVFGYGLGGFSRAIIITEALLNFLLLGGIRFGVRWFSESFAKTRAKQSTDLLIVGAGKAGTQLLNEIRLNTHSGMRVVGFIDDDPMKKNAYIQGVRVLGNSKDIPKLVKKLKIDEVIIAIPSAGFRKQRSIIQAVRECGVKVKTLPSLIELIQKTDLWGQLRNASFDELLGRPILRFRRESDLELLKDEIQGKNVLITGAAGSIGSELSYQTAELTPNVLILYERSESALYFLELNLRKLYPKCNVIPVVGDVLDKKKFSRIVSQHKVDLIYHAAAYKQVPMMEREPLEAVRNNILATKIVAKTTIVNRVKKCVYISTDKAVNPSSIMGATKRIGELVIQGFSGKGAKFIIVRFGNVIGSNGSAFQLFKKQIAEGGPVTVTDPEASRYFMSTSEAVQLVMTAGAMGTGREIFLLDMGKPIKIVDMVRRLVEASGLKVGKDIDIKYIGLRPGEKLHEQLYWKGENIIPTKNKKITMLNGIGFQKDVMFAQVKRLEELTHESNNERILEIMNYLVPEGTFNHNSSNGKNGKNGHSFLKLKLREPILRAE